MAVLFFVIPHVREAVAGDYTVGYSDATFPARVPLTTVMTVHVYD
ncbi:hypothetical protein BTBSAS_110075 [Brochothrix thermosphacta]|uniref:Uncharacterized protein n=1 Tax=Brochothrix thermosphacta TaxID=2756 RepID=A0A2X0QDJ6_BROTH|nr:hypothetical protein BTBSAS_110075 [Brochothrix thermosphacta]